MQARQFDDLLTKMRQVRPKEIIVGGPVSDLRIHQVATEMGVSFCPDYTEFLQQYGYIAIHAAYLVGIDNGSFDSGRKILEDVRVQAEEYSSIYDTSIGLTRTILLNSDNEWYQLLDHSDGKVYSFDPITDQVREYKSCLEEAILEFLTSRLQGMLNDPYEAVLAASDPTS